MCAPVHTAPDAEAYAALELKAQDQIRGTKITIPEK
jgi:hypothetical protein